MATTRLQLLGLTKKKRI